MNITLPDSRKLTGMLITIIALLVLALIATVAVAWWSAPVSIFEVIGGYIAGIGGAHQAAQATADRSPAYTEASAQLKAQAVAQAAATAGVPVVATPLTAPLTAPVDPPAYVGQGKD